MEKIKPIFTGKPGEPLPVQEEIDLGALMAVDDIDSGTAPLLDLEMELTGAIKATIAASGYGREQIVDRMNLCLRDSGIQVTKQKLDKWLAPSQGLKPFPAWALGPLCWAVGSILPYQRLLAPLGYEVINQRDNAALEYGQRQYDLLRQQKELKNLKKKMGNQL